MMRKLVLKEPYKLEMTTAEIPEPAENQVRIHVNKIGICGSDPTISWACTPTFPIRW